MVALKLTLSELWLLLRTSLGESPQISPEVIAKFQKRGFFRAPSIEITDDGHQYAHVFGDYVERLRNGVALSTPHDSRAQDALATGPWYVSYSKKDRIAWNKEIVIRHDDFLPPNPIRVPNSQKPAWEKLFWKWESLARSSWDTAEAYAIQTDGTEHGPMCAVIRHKVAFPDDQLDGVFSVNRGHPILDRIQLKYHDLIKELFPNVQWMRKPSGARTRRCVAARVKYGKGWNRKAIAFVCTVQTINWPMPLFFTKEERERLKPKPKVYYIDGLSDILRKDLRKSSMDYESHRNQGWNEDIPDEFLRTLPGYGGDDGLLSSGEPD